MVIANIAELLHINYLLGIINMKQSVIPLMGLIEATTLLDMSYLIVYRVAVYVIAPKMNLI
jgi:hypothetical protein